jgi:hypothetical protein
MNNGDRIGLVLLLMFSLVLIGLVLGSASISGYSIYDLIGKGSSQNSPQSYMSIFTIFLLASTVLVILMSYYLHSKTD